MTWKQKIEKMFATGIFDTTSKLMMVLYYWLLGRITNSDATALFLQCGFTFTVPTTTGATILTDGATSPAEFTIVTLITQYHVNYANSYLSTDEATDTIDIAYSDGYITDAEQTSLKGLGW